MVLVILCTLDYTFWQLGAALAYLDGDACLGTRIPPTTLMLGSPNTHSNLDAKVARVAS